MNFASPSLRLMELTMPLPWTHFKPGLDHRPFRAVDHDRHAGDVRFRSDQIQEMRHGLLGIEHSFVHVDVNDLRAVLDLLLGDGQRFLVLPGQDELGEFGRAGDVGALADVDEIGVRPDASAPPGRSAAV